MAHEGLELWVEELTRLRRLNQYYREKAEAEVVGFLKWSSLLEWWVEMGGVFVDVKQDKLVAGVSCKGHWGDDDSPHYQNLQSLDLRHREPWPFGRPPTSGQTWDSTCIASGKRQLYDDNEDTLCTTTRKGNKGQLGRLLRGQRHRRDWPHPSWLNSTTCIIQINCKYIKST